MSAAMLPLLGEMQRLIAEGRSCVLATMISTRGHAPQDPGAKILLSDDGLVAGTIGGGKLEARVMREAQALMTLGKSEPILFDWDLQKDLGMSCGGSVRLLLEVFHNHSWHLHIFGAGHVAQALCRLLLHLPCYITCVDTREEWIARLPRSPKIKAFHIDSLDKFAADLAPHSYAVVLTMGHGTDLPILKILLARGDMHFVGSMGSRVKARLMRADLGRAGLSKEQIEPLHCPIGIAFTSRIPEEIAVSICAQLLQIRQAKMNVKD